MNNTKKKVVSSFIWRFSERILAQGVSFLVSIILARILLPEDYGAVSIVLVIINLADVLVTSGFATALIQDKDATTADYSTIMYCSVAFSIITYVLLFYSAPAIASFYHLDSLKNIIRVLGLRIIVGSYNSIQHAYVSHHLLFKRFFFSTLFGTILSGIVGIIMAYKGFGTWSLVAQYLTNSITDTIVLFFTIQWKPTLEFSRKRAKELLRYGWKITAGELLSAGYNDLRSMVIGRVYSTSDLAFYSRGEQFPKLITSNINTSISSVLFPAISNVHDDCSEVKRYTKKAIRTSSYVVFPLMVGLMAIAPMLVRVLLTNKWDQCIPFLQLCCITYAFIPINSANIQATKAIGRSDLFLKTEIIKKTIGIISIIVSMRISVMAIAISSVLINLFAIIVNVGINIQTIQYGYREQLGDVFPSLMASIAMGATVYCIGYIQIQPILCLLLQLFAGFIVYVIISSCLRIPEYYEFKGYLMRFIKR